jgi:hypothetical protein
MPEASKLNDDFKVIVETAVYSSLESTVANELHIVRAISRLLLTRDADAILPPLPPGNRSTAAFPPLIGSITAALQHQLRLGWDDGRLRDATNFARDITGELRNCIQMMSSAPPDQNQANRLTMTFGSLASRFVLAWSFLLPALEVESVDAMRKELQNALDSAKTKLDAINTILTTAQEASKELGASKHAGAFLNLSKQYKRRAARSLVCTVTVAVIFILAVIWSSYRIADIARDDYPKLVQVLVGKILMLGVVYYLLVLAARSWRANSHLAAVNLHRATALQVFATFAESTSDEQTKNAILLETTRCIYTHTSTGFLGGEEPSSPLQIVEILKALGPNRPS